VKQHNPSRILFVDIVRVHRDCQKARTGRQAVIAAGEQKTTIGHFIQYDPNLLIADTCIAQSLQSYFPPVYNQCAGVLLSRNLTTKKGQPHSVTVPSMEQSPKLGCCLCTMILHKLSPVDLGSRSPAVTVMGIIEVQTNPKIYPSMQNNTLMTRASSGLSNPFWVRPVSVSRLHIQDIVHNCRV